MNPPTKPSRLPHQMSVLSVLVLVLLISYDATVSIQITGTYSLAVVIAAIAASARFTIGIGVAAVIFAFLSAGWDANVGMTEWTIRLLSCIAISIAAVVNVYVRDHNVAQLQRMTVIAEIAQRAVLRPMPDQVGNINFAAQYISASEDALIGGDLYEVLQTPHGIRLIVGDVKGKGMEAVQIASLVLGAFRAAAVNQPTLEKMAVVLDEVVTASGGDEDFVTALLVEFSNDTMTIANCGHHPPLLINPKSAAAFAYTGTETLPLGLGAAPETTVHPWIAGSRMLLYTDGLVEARDKQGEFFPLLARIQRASEKSLDKTLDNLILELRKHTEDLLDDDMALVIAQRR